MAIKRIEFKGLTSSSIAHTAFGGIRFHDKYGSIIQSGAIITNTAIAGETENFLLTATSSSATYGYVAYAFDTSKSDIASSYSYNYWINGSDNQNLSVTFKTLIDTISMITFNIRPEQSDRGVDTNFKIAIYDENDILSKEYTITPESNNINHIQKLLFFEPLEKEKLILKNPTTNQHYSLAEKTLIPLPDASDKNMILYGIEAGVEINLDEPFDKIRTITDNDDGTQTVSDETVDSFSVYDYISENPQVVIYTESTDDITVSTTTEPFTLYDEFGDEVEVLYYTDDEAVTEADLILEANWSPIDELEGNFEVVTWTDESDSTRTLELNGIPSPKLIYKTTVNNIGGTLSGIILNDSSTYATSSKVRFLLTTNNSTWYKWNGTNFENVTYSKVADILTLGNTYDELSNADFSKWTHSKINIGVFLKDDDNTTSKVNELGIITNSPILTSQVSNLNFYILNTTAKIELDLKGLWLSGQLSDLDLTRVQYRVFLNEQPYYPLSGEFTSLSNPPLNIDITFKSEEIKINDWNTLRVEFKDSFGTVDYWQTTFVGNYSSLMFMDVDGNYYSDDVGKVLQYLDFGTFFGGQYSVEHEVIIKNQYGYDVKNLILETNTGHLPEGVDVEFSDTTEPFIPQPSLLLPNELKNDEQVSFYIRMISDIDSVPNGENKFNIFVKAERKV